MQRGGTDLYKPVFVAFWNLFKLLPTGHKTSSQESALGFLVWCSTICNTAEVSQEVGGVLIGRSFSLLSLLGIWGIQWKFSTFCFYGFFHLFSKKKCILFSYISRPDITSLGQPHSCLTPPKSQKHIHVLPHPVLLWIFVCLFLSQLCMKREGRSRSIFKKRWFHVQVKKHLSQPGSVDACL